MMFYDVLLSFVRHRTGDLSSIGYTRERKGFFGQMPFHYHQVCPIHTVRKDNYYIEAETSRPRINSPTQSSLPSDPNAATQP